MPTGTILFLGRVLDPDFDPARDLLPVGMVATVPSIFVINPAVPATNMVELIAANRDFAPILVNTRKEPLTIEGIAVGLIRDGRTL